MRVCLSFNFSGWPIKYPYNARLEAAKGTKKSFLLIYDAAESDRPDQRKLCIYVGWWLQIENGVFCELTQDLSALNLYCRVKNQ
jgi:hypothetical protein